MNLEKIGRFIAQCRKDLGFTQETLGNKLGVTDKAVSKWERGLSCPDILLLNRLSTELKVGLHELLNGEKYEDVKNSNSIFSTNVEQISRTHLLDKEVRIESFGYSNYYVSPLLFGNNLEHTRRAVSDGLSAQMLRNRKFVGFPSERWGVAQEWFRIGERAYCFFSRGYTRHLKEYYHMSRRFERNSQNVRNFHAGEVCGIGQHGLYVQCGKEYDFAVVAKVSDKIKLTVALTDQSGEKLYASTHIDVNVQKDAENNDEWVRYTAKLISNTTDADADIRLTFDTEGCIAIGVLSLMPSDNFRGMRRDVIAAMKQVGTSVLRWPGGNFAGEYSWFDGLLPVDERSPFESYLGIMTQPNTLGYDFHEINTDDFIALCREIGAEPYIALNLTWNTPEENAAWVEYCNGGPDTKWGRMRIERGFEEPYDVKLWALGNEFGYGHMEGDNTSYGYSRIAKEHAKALLGVCPDLLLCSCGPYPNEEWAQHAAKALKGTAPLVAMHYYCDPEPNYFDSTKFEDEYYRSILSVNTIKNNLYELKAHTDGDIKISFDEWNMWNAWYRSSCVGDGIFSALVLQMLMAEAENCGIEIACSFGVTNQGTIEISANEVKLTAQGQIFELMKRHSGGRLMHVSDCVTATKKDGVITLTAVNVSYNDTKRIVFPAFGDAESLLCLHQTF